MIKNLTITNFRTHRLVELKQLGRVNVLLGKNNSGKTAALEALFFLSLPLNPREVLVRLNELRGYGAGTDPEGKPCSSGEAASFPQRYSSRCRA